MWRRRQRRGVGCDEAEWVRPSAAHGDARRTSLVNLVDHVANGLVIESRPTAVGENFQVVCTSLKTTDDYEEGVKFHSAIAAVKMAAASAAASPAPPPSQWRRRRHRLRWWLRRLRLRYRKKPELKKDHATAHKTIMKRQTHCKAVHFVPRLHRRRRAAAPCRLTDNL